MSGRHLPSLAAEDVLLCLESLASSASASPPMVCDTEAPSVLPEQHAIQISADSIMSPSLGTSLETTSFRLHVNGYRRVLEVQVPLTTPVAVMKEICWRKQKQHPHALSPNARSRLVFLRQRSKTMNTTCRFDQDDVLEDFEGEQPLTIEDVLPLDDVFLYVLCPGEPLMNEHGQHRRLAKRQLGMCESHRNRGKRSIARTRDSKKVTFSNSDKGNASSKPAIGRRPIRGRSHQTGTSNQGSTSTNHHVRKLLTDKYWDALVVPESAHLFDNISNCPNSSLLELLEPGLERFHQTGVHHCHDLCACA